VKLLYILKVKNVLVKSVNYVTDTPPAMLLPETDEADLSEFV